MKFSKKLKSGWGKHLDIAKHPCNPSDGVEGRGDLGDSEAHWPARLAESKIFRCSDRWGQKLKVESNQEKTSITDLSSRAYAFMHTS